MGLLKVFKNSCMSGSKMSSKRIIMYTFTIVIIGMLCVEAAFNLMLMWEWGMEGCDNEVKFQTVFNMVIYGYIFGIIGALAGINGWSDKGKKKIETEEL